MTKEQEEAIERLEKRIKDNEDYKTTQVWLTDDVSAVYTVLNMLKENSAELAEKSAEIEKKDKIIDLMAERIEWLCKSNGILLDKEHDENFIQQDIKQYFERKVKND